MFGEASQIEFESNETLKQFYEEFNKEENKYKFTLPNIPYSIYEIVREITRRGNFEQ